MISGATVRECAINEQVKIVSNSKAIKEYKEVHRMLVSGYSSSRIRCIQIAHFAFCTRD